MICSWILSLVGGFNWINLMHDCLQTMQSKRNAPSAMVARQSLKDEELVSHLSLKFKLQQLLLFFSCVGWYISFCEGKKIGFNFIRLKLDNNNNNIQLKKWFQVHFWPQKFVLCSKILAIFSFETCSRHFKIKDAFYIKLSIEIITS